LGTTPLDLGGLSTLFQPLAWTAKILYLSRNRDAKTNASLLPLTALLLDYINNSAVKKI
jgi:hypothetical protein